jgi:NAD(P)-dependent dehydrogenase (short-subunit alcohol dehydrogenase family)
MVENGPDFNLDGKVALVTGAASGLGAATARIFAAQGARVLCADVDQKGARKISDEIRGRAIYVDLADPTSAEATVQEILDTEDRIDVLVNNAGWTSSARRRR